MTIQILFSRDKWDVYNLRYASEPLIVSSFFPSQQLHQHFCQWTLKNDSGGRMSSKTILLTSYILKPSYTANLYNCPLSEVLTNQQSRTRKLQVDRVESSFRLHSCLPNGNRWGEKCLQNTNIVLQRKSKNHSICYR